MNSNQGNKKSNDAFVTNRSLKLVTIQISEDYRSVEQEEDNVSKQIKLILIFGKFIGLIPIEGILKSNPLNLNFRHGSMNALISIVVMIMVAVYAGISLISIFTRSISSVNELGGTISKMIFCSIGIFLYAYFYTKSRQLIEILRGWNNLDIYFSRPDISLFRDANLVAFIILSSAIMENFVNHLTLFPVFVSPD
ncbi:unnamed protein product, partial [Allacma fusca]